jgi:SAM-dependent methyltransferase
MPVHSNGEGADMNPEPRMAAIFGHPDDETFLVGGTRVKSIFFDGRGTMKLYAWLFAFAAVAMGQVPHQHHPPLSSDEYAKVLEDPSRDAWQKPHAVVMALDLKPTDTVADIGAGSGYFARRFALHAGRVYAVDIDEKLLAMVRSNAPANLETIVAVSDNPHLPQQSIDMIFFCNVLHHIENRPAYYVKLAKVLKPGGRIVVIDFYKNLCQSALRCR